MDGQQLHRRDAQLMEMVDDRLGGNPQIRATKRFGNVRVLLRDALNVCLVDERVFPRNARRLVVAPGKGFFDDGTERSIRGTVPLVKRQIFAVAADVVAEQTVVPAQWPSDGLGVRVEEHLIRVKPVPACGVVRPVDAVAVELARPQIRHVAVPDGPGALRKLKCRRRLAVVGMIEQQQLDFLGIGAVQREIDADSVPRCSSRVRRSRPDRKPMLVVRFSSPGSRPLIRRRRVTTGVAIARRRPRAGGRIRARSSGRERSGRGTRVRRAAGGARTRVHNRGDHWGNAVLSVRRRVERRASAPS